uniref:Serine aminopeptidase S33 domain-containing protein n=1 Tax=Arcella intermedia TaxID=1963864 RepID=A0A6B2L319_9EUKA
MMVSGKHYFRADFKVIKVRNCHGLTIECSIFKPKNVETNVCVVYNHGNAGCRLDGLEALELAACYDLSLCCFDFCGSGLSEGGVTTLGWNEKHDIEAVVNYLIEHEHYKKFFLWGRSMGSVSILMYLHEITQEQPNKLEELLGVILDSPFCDLCELSSEIAQAQSPLLISPIVSLGLFGVRRTIRRKTKFDIKELNLLQKVGLLMTPVVFLHGETDDFVTPEHSLKLFFRYGSPTKYYFLVQGGHNCPRGADFFDAVSNFVFERLKEATLTTKSSPTKSSEKGKTVYLVNSLKSEEQQILSSDEIKILNSLKEPELKSLEKEDNPIIMETDQGKLVFSPETPLIDLKMGEKVMSTLNMGLEKGEQVLQSLDIDQLDISDIIPKLSEKVHQLLSDTTQSIHLNPEKITLLLYQEVKGLLHLNPIFHHILEKAILKMVTKIWEEWKQKQ